MCWSCGAQKKLEKVENNDDVDGRCPRCGKEFESVDWDGNPRRQTKRLSNDSA